MRRIVLFLFLLLTTILAAQAVKEVEITAEPHHQLVLENAQVRVFDVNVPPHTDTLMHWHRHEYIYVMLGASEVVNAVKGKDPVTTKLQDGQAGFVPGHFAHIDSPLTNGTQPAASTFCTEGRKKFSLSTTASASPNLNSSLEASCPCTTTLARICS
jgi:hypothetical protein